MDLLHDALVFGLGVLTGFVGLAVVTGFLHQFVPTHKGLTKG
jgi:hypothetical protein